MYFVPHNPNVFLASDGTLSLLRTPHMTMTQDDFEQPRPRIKGLSPQPPQHIFRMTMILVIVIVVLVIVIAA